MLARQKLIGSSEDNAREHKHCNCKRSNCLKLYCECFATGVYCRANCHCVNCFNNQKTEYLRRTAVETTLDRNPNAFRPKIVQENKNVLVTEGKQGPTRHHKGCQCKKSWCLKKYCECFQANTYCTSKCKCHDCKNFEGSVFRDKIAPRPLSSARADAKQEHGSDTDSLEAEIMEIEIRANAGSNMGSEPSHDDFDTQASSSNDDRKRSATSETTRLAAFLTDEKIASISAELVRVARQPVSQHAERMSTPSPRPDSESSHMSKRACTSNDRQTVDSGDNSPAVDDLLACAERVDGTPEPATHPPPEQFESVEPHNPVQDEVILQTFSDALRELAYEILPNSSS